LGIEEVKTYIVPAERQIDQVASLLDKVVLRIKGKLSAINKEIENSEVFRQARRTHSAVESSISALRFFLITYIVLIDNGHIFLNIFLVKENLSRKF
jgi:hypothetical protein